MSKVRYEGEGEEMEDVEQLDEDCLQNCASETIEMFLNYSNNHINGILSAFDEFLYIYDKKEKESKVEGFVFLELFKANILALVAKEIRNMEETVENSLLEKSKKDAISKRLHSKIEGISYDVDGSLCRYTQIISSFYTSSLEI